VRLAEEECKEDPCVRFMREETDEAKKVIRNEGNIWHAVFRKMGTQEAKESKDVRDKVMGFYL